MKVWITWTLFFLLFVYNILDAHHTTLLLNANIGVVEGNPIMAYAIDQYGMIALFIINIAWFFLLAMLLIFHQIDFKKGNKKHEKWNF